MKSIHLPIFSGYITIFSLPSCLQELIPLQCSTSYSFVAHLPSMKGTRYCWDRNINISCSKELLLELVQVNLGPCLQQRYQIVQVPSIESSCSTNGLCKRVVDCSIVAIIGQNIIYGSKTASRKESDLWSRFLLFMVPHKHASTHVFRNRRGHHRVKLPRNAHNQFLTR